MAQSAPLMAGKNAQGQRGSRKTKKRLRIVGLAPATACCLVGAWAGYLARRTSTHPVQREGFQVMIFGQRATARALGSMVKGGATAYWTPGRREVAALERRLSERVAREHPGLVVTFAQ